MNKITFIFSDDVFEHVRNYPETIYELSRVLKPDGICLHTFVSCYRPIETHTFIPLSSIIQSYRWLNLWALLGVGSKRNVEQSLKEKIKFYHDYLNNNTNYLPKRSLRNYFSASFNDVKFCEKELLMFSQRGRRYFSFRRSFHLSRHFKALSV